MKTKFQLVFQFPAKTLEDFDRLTALEEAIYVELKGSKETKLDGHDCGRGEYNIFLHTNNPQADFAKFADLIGQFSPDLAFSAGYRSFEDDKYTALWPASFTTFSVA